MVKKILGSLLVFSFLFMLGIGPVMAQSADWGSIEELKVSGAYFDSGVIFVYDSGSDEYVQQNPDGFTHYIRYDSVEDTYDLYEDTNERSSSPTLLGDYTGMYDFTVSLSLSNQAGSLMSSIVSDAGSIIFAIMAPILALAGTLIALFFGFRQLRKWVGGSRS